MATTRTQQFILPNDTPVVFLDCRKSFNHLTKQEKLYAHHFSKACWDGAGICVVQTSPESPLVYSLLHRIFVVEQPCDLRDKCEEIGIESDEFTVNI